MRYRSLNEALRCDFGGKVYKLALQGVSTCPNRDGTAGHDGCIFCSGWGSGEFAAVGADIMEQIADAKRRVAEKAPEGAQYIAYFQSFTNTYAPVEILRQRFTAAIAPPEIVALSVATRPDCLGDEVLALLEELNRKKPVWVELGLQTIHETTARYIRRGYDLPVFDEAVRALKARSIAAIAHQIIGLPGETEAMIWQTADHIARSGVDGVKFHLLHVLRGTDLAKDYAAGKFCTLEMEEYFRLLSGCIERQRPDTVIHRLTGDGAKRDLIAPLWSADKKRVLNALHRYLEEHDVQQGRLWGGS
ncbi:MAG: TIGR01212 family radical SAM protein [Ruminococcaceae bacterium]|nr:TIGR01212 family radical SAM protein [Oscillospiraceae bacterium]